MLFRETLGCYGKNRPKFVNTMRACVRNKVCVSRQFPQQYKRGRPEICEGSRQPNNMAPPGKLNI